MLLHFIVAAGLVVVRPKSSRVFLLGGIPSAVTFAWLLGRLPAILDGETIVAPLGWVDALSLSLTLRLDGFAWIMAALVSGVGILVFVYAASYFEGRRDPALLASLLVAFSGSMLGLVLADSVLGLFVFWELTSITSYLLIGIDDARAEARASARHALVVTGGGGLAMLAGLVILGQGAGDFTISAITQMPPTGSAATVAAVLVLIGAATKSAQVPFHAWLPGAMTAPTPVSTYLHSATMVKAGIYLIARFAPSFAETYGFWRPTLIALGIVTMIFGGVVALRHDDLKLLLAYGTVSQLGFMTALLGAGVPELSFAGIAVILAHGLFKSSLFMTTGIVDHQTHTRDITRLNGLYRKLPVTATAALLAAASMAGIPPLLGFVGKEAALAGALDYLPGGSTITTLGLVVGSALTVAYGIRFVRGAFGTKSPAELADEPVTDAARPTRQLVGSALVPALAGLLFGLAPGLLDEFVGTATESLGVDVDKHLALWHGFNAALVASFVAIAAGVVVYLFVRAASIRQRRPVPRAVGASMFEAVMDRLGAFASRVTAVAQSGSLPIYLAVILMTAVTLPAWALLGAELPDDAVFADSTLQVLTAAIAVAAAIGAATATRRFVAVLALGAVGYSVAVLFVIQGAPDLALTQFLVETLAVVFFVLVLRNLPARFSESSFRSQPILRACIAAGVGTFVAIFVLVAGGSRSSPPVSERQLDIALPEGGGRNVVNVILTDIRALDTLGEITVLTVTAIGVASLVLAVRRDRKETS